MKDESVYLFKDAKYLMKNRPNYNFVDDDNNNYEIVEIFDKSKYEQAVSECKKCFGWEEH